MNPSPILLESTLPELPHLGFRRYLPQLPLREWIQCYWLAYQPHLPDGGVSETQYPDGGTSLIFSFHNRQRPTCIFKAEQTTRKIYFHHALDCLGIRFHPGAAFKLLGIAIDFESTQRPILLELSLDSVQQQLADANTTYMRLAIIENWLLAKLQQKKPEPGLLQHFIPRFLTSHLSFGEFVKLEALNRRQVERKFQLEVGLSPAHFKLLHRIKRARQLITVNPVTDLTGIALDCGFYDQAHFIRQFHQTTGQTPGQYKNRKMSQKYNR